MTMFTLLVCALAAWRLAHMLIYEAGPWRVFARLRALTKLGGILDCLYCCSAWTALLFIALAMFFWDSAAVQVFTYTFAVSGAALMLSVYIGINFRTPEGMEDGTN